MNQTNGKATSVTRKKKSTKRPLPKKSFVCQEIKSLLLERSERVVFVESCTAGLASATLARIPGASEVHCGCMATYRADSKKKWAGVSRRTIKNFSTESQQCATAMAVGALKRTPEATWACAIVGHLGPNAPAEKDGQVFISIARRSKKGNIRIRHESEKVFSGDRVSRMNNASEFLLKTFGEVLFDQNTSDQRKLEPVVNEEPEDQ